MAVYDLEEQEQLDDLKAWWARWGNTVATVLVVASLAAAAVQGWRWWTVPQGGGSRGAVQRRGQAARANDVAKAKDASPQLTDKYSGTGYAPRAAFLVAKMQFDAGDTAAARAQLQWVVDHADEQELKEIARYRLAELMLNDKQYDEALRCWTRSTANRSPACTPTCAAMRTPPRAAPPKRAPRTRKR